MTNDITSYLLLPEQAAWAKEKGFDGICDWLQCDDEKGYQKPVSKSMRNSSEFPVFYPNHFTIPTFEQMFDWVEEKFLLHVALRVNTKEFPSIHRVFISSLAEGGDKIFIDGSFETKRAARLFAVSEIIKYIDNLKK